MVAFKREQYHTWQETFEKKYNNRSVRIEPGEIPEIAEDLIELIIVPESKDWLVIFDHEGDISFNGEKEFVEKVKEFFDDWEELSEFPERRSFGKRD